MIEIPTEELLALFLKHRRVSTDTRSLEPGAIFFAIQGERFNGNAYAAQALEKGASYVVVDDTQYLDPSDSRYLWVEDALQAIQDLAHAYRMRFDIPVLGLTGSNGKTTTKELIKAVLETEKQVHATSGNFNNHLGVPLTLLAMPEDTEVGIIEMGANQPGDIQELCEIAYPTLGLITNIGAAHLERLQSLEGVMETKGALFRHVERHGGKIFLNNSDERVVKLGEDLERAATYGNKQSDVYAHILEQGLEGLELDVYQRGIFPPLRVHSALSGAYNALNICAAVAIGDYFGIAQESIQKGIAAYIPTNNRSQVLKRDGIMYWLDAYNANPSSMEAAIAHVCSLRDPQEVVLVLGDMFELGPDEKTVHRELGEFINEFHPGLTIGIGPLMQELVAAVSSPSKGYATLEAAKAHFAQDLADKKLVLIKGSRGMKLEGLLAD